MTSGLISAHLVLLVWISSVVSQRQPFQGSCMNRWLSHAGVPRGMHSQYEKVMKRHVIDERTIRRDPNNQKLLRLLMTGHEDHSTQFIRCITHQAPSCSDVSPCSIGGTCLYSQKSNSFKCDCTEGITGTFCNEDIDECSASTHHCPLNTSRCINIYPGYTCACRPGFQQRGSNCIDIDECQSSPCGPNSRLCENLRNKFNCVCNPGYTGKRCEIDVGECRNSPCLNGGTCFNLKGGMFLCKCPMGYDGDVCQDHWFHRTFFKKMENRLEKLLVMIGKKVYNDAADQEVARSCEDRLTKVKKIPLLFREKEDSNITHYDFTSAVIDPDGFGGVHPFPVSCVWNSTEKRMYTVIHHNQELRTEVKGYEAAGSYRAPLVYKGVAIQQAAELVKRSKNCQQFIKYDCKGSLFLSTSGPFIQRFAYWVDRAGNKMYHWGGAAPGSNSCACAKAGTCPTGHTCNCNINDNIWRSDSGYLTDKDHLPIKEVRFGDTGDANEIGYHTIGPLMCN